MSTIASHSPLNFSKTVRDRRLDTKYQQLQMAYGESNGYVTNDVTWPRTARDPLKSII